MEISPYREGHDWVRKDVTVRQNGQEVTCKVCRDKVDLNLGLVHEKNYMFTNMKVSVYEGRISLNSTDLTTVKETHSGTTTHTVKLDGYIYDGPKMWIASCNGNVYSCESSLFKHKVGTPENITWPITAKVVVNDKVIIECDVVPNHDHSQADMPSVSAPAQLSTADQDNITELAFNRVMVPEELAVNDDNIDADLNIAAYLDTPDIEK